MPFTLDDVALLLDRLAQQNVGIIAALERSAAAIAGLEMSPVVQVQEREVPAPSVTVTAPDVVVPAPDLSEVIAVLRQALADVAAENGRVEQTIEEGLRHLSEVIGKVSAAPRVTGKGGIGPVQVKDTGGALIDPATKGEQQTIQGLLEDVKRSVTDYESRLDYDVRTDGNPVYVGKAPEGTATSATGWTIQKLTYDGSDRLTRAQVLTGVWDDRASLGW